MYVCMYVYVDDMCIHIYIYIYICILEPVDAGRELPQLGVARLALRPLLCHTYIYIYVERERERERCVCTYTYDYI